MRESNVLPFFETVFDKALNYHNQGNHEKALVLYGRLARGLNRTYQMFSMNNAGSIFLKRKEYHVAICIFEEAVLIFPEEGNLWFGYAVCLDNIGKYQEAFDAYSTAATLVIRETYRKHIQKRLKVLGVEIGKIRQIY